MGKIIIVCGTNDMGYSYMRELVKEQKLTNVKHNQFILCSTLEKAKSTESGLPFLVIPFGYNRKPSRIETVEKLSKELWVGRHSEIQPHQVKEYL